MVFGSPVRSLLGWVIKNEALYRLTPKVIKRLTRRAVPSHVFNERLWEKENPYLGTPDAVRRDFGSEVRVGIVHDFCHYHVNYVKACHDLRLSYEVLRLDASDWIHRFEESESDVFMIWPSNYSTAWKQLFDERLYLLSTRMRRPIFPSLLELWLYESKKRVRDWLVLHRIPHPETHVFYSRDEARSFVSQAALPLVFKTDLGGASHGVELVETRKRAAKLVDLCFGKGYRVRRGDDRDRRWGYVIFQQHIDVRREWRIVRIGESFFCRLKHKRGRFFSGSGVHSWEQPPEGLLDFVFELTERFGFLSMAVDFFETGSKSFLVNELQSLFGGIRPENAMRGHEHEGRYVVDSESGGWVFESGDFYTNACANLRVACAVQLVQESARLSDETGQ